MQYSCLQYSWKKYAFVVPLPGNRMHLCMQRAVAYYTLTTQTSKHLRKKNAMEQVSRCFKLQLQKHDILTVAVNPFVTGMVAWNLVEQPNKLISY